MAFVGMFMGGSPGSLIASGQAVLNLQWQAEDRADIQGASFTIAGAGYSKTIQADNTGRAEVLVESGKTYTIAVNHTGEYSADEPQSVTPESQKSYVVLFVGYNPVKSASKALTWIKSTFDAVKPNGHEVLLNIHVNNRDNVRFAGDSIVTMPFNSEMRTSIAVLSAGISGNNISTGTVSVFLKVTDNGVISIKPERDSNVMGEVDSARMSTGNRFDANIVSCYYR